jgi:hypothetical protein
MDHFRPQPGTDKTLRALRKRYTKALLILDEAMHSE